MTIAEKLTRAKVDYDEVYEAGKEQGIAEGKTKVYNEIEPINTQLENTLNGTDTGGKSFYDVFWDTAQENGNRRSYQYAFADVGLTWADENYNPKYPIICGDEHVYTATALFHGNGKITDTKVPITISNTRADNCFYSCARLKRIPSLTFENVIRFVNTFNNCISLEELYCKGVIDVDGLNLQWSPKLSKASITSIINCLSTATSGLSATLSKTAVESAFGSTESEEWTTLINARSNWTINLL